MADLLYNRNEPAMGLRESISETILLRKPVYKQITLRLVSLFKLLATLKTSALKSSSSQELNQYGG